MVDRKAEICKVCPDGNVVVNFNPPNKCPDSEDVGQGWNVDNPRIGCCSEEKARARTDDRFVRFAIDCDYHVSIPCIFCSQCIIVREFKEGNLCNAAYFCRMLRRKVERCGTCRRAMESKHGPVIIRRDVTVDEALQAMKKKKEGLREG